MFGVQIGLCAKVVVRFLKRARSRANTQHAVALLPPEFVFLQIFVGDVMRP